MLARALLATGDYDESVEVCNRLLERKPDDIPTLLVRANAYIGSRRNYEAALADAERVLEIDPDNVEALIPRTVALLAPRARGGGQRGARAAGGPLPGRQPRDCTARPASAPRAPPSRRRKGITSSAAERYDACLEPFPEWAPLVQDAVEFFDALGADEHAQEILERAVEASPRQSATCASVADASPRPGRDRARRRR